MDEQTTPAQDFSREQPLMPDDWHEGDALPAPDPAPTAPEPTEKAGIEPAPEPAPEAPARDFSAEAASLLSARPELAGRSLPDAVTRAAVEQGVPLLQAFLDYEQTQLRSELERLREENRVFRQNEAAARRSPVQGVAGSGADDAETDPFLAGFSGAGW